MHNKNVTVGEERGNRMTLEDAIEILEEIKEFDDSIYAYDPMYMEALETAIKALKGKQNDNSKIQT